MNAFSDRGLDFRIARGEDDRIAVLQLCADVYRQQFGAEPIGDPAFDRQGRLFGAWKDDVVVGTLRYVPDGPLGLPLEAPSRTSCDEWRSRGAICEMGRFAMRNQSGTNPFVLMGLVRLTFWCAIGDGVRYLFTCAPKRLWPLYQRMRFEAYGTPFMHPAGEVFLLGVTDLGDSIARALEEDESGLRANFLHELVDHRSEEEDASLRKYLAGLNSASRGASLGG